MSGTKQRKQYDQSPTISPKSCHKLFVDYPYPIINELSKTSEQRKSTVHLHTLASLKWCRGCFHRMFGVLHNIHSHTSSTSIIEESFIQAHTDGHSSKAVINNLQKHSKPTHTRRTLATSSSMSLSTNEEKKKEENNN